MRICSAIEDRKVWIHDPSGCFSCKSAFYCLTSNNDIPNFFPTKILWKASFLSKVMVSSGFYHWASWMFMTFCKEDPIICHLRVGVFFVIRIVNCLTIHSYMVVSLLGSGVCDKNQQDKLEQIQRWIKEYSLRGDVLVMYIDLRKEIAETRWWVFKRPIRSPLSWAQFPLPNFAYTNPQLSPHRIHGVTNLLTIETTLTTQLPNQQSN